MGLAWGREGQTRDTSMDTTGPCRWGRGQVLLRNTMRGGRMSTLEQQVQVRARECVCTKACAPALMSVTVLDAS